MKKLLLVLALVCVPALPCEAQWFNVKDYGATGDGVTDDTAAVQAAIDAIPNGGPVRGGVLYFPIGKYKITGVAFGNHKSIHVLGDTGASFNDAQGYENGTQILVAADGATGFSFDGGSAITNYWGPVIEHLAFSDVSPSGKTATLLGIVNTTHWTVRNCTFRNAAVGIKIDSGRPAYPNGDNTFALVEQSVFRNNSVSVHAPHTFGFLVLGGAIHMLGTGQVGILAGGAGVYAAQGVKIVGLQTYGGTGVDITGSYNMISTSYFETSPLVIRGDPSRPWVNGQSNVVSTCHLSGTGTQTGITIHAGTTKTRLVANSFLNLAQDVQDSGTGTIVVGQ